MTRSVASARNRIPDPSTWRSEKVSQRHVGDYKPFMFVDGEGVRCSLYVSGCLFACDGCFNEAAWSFRYGTPYTADLEDRILADLAQPHVQGLSLLGGEPFLNTGVCLQLVGRVRRELGHTKDIWAWSGYTFEELIEETPDKRALLGELDVLVDGRYVHALRDAQLAFRGSRNQRILDVPASLVAGAAIPWEPQAGAAAA